VGKAYRAGGRKPAQLPTATVWPKPEISFTNAVHAEAADEAWVNGDNGTAKKSVKHNNKT
jgi:hypothetical protein